MALIVNLDRGEQIDARELSSVQELGSHTTYMQWVMHLLSSHDSSHSQWPRGGRWLGNSIWVCQENDYCPSARVRLLVLKPELEHPNCGSSKLSAFQLVELACKKLNAEFQE